MPNAFHYFDPFVEALAAKKHNLQTDSLIIALCAAAHLPVAANGVLADLTEIAYTNCSSRAVTTVSCVQTAGVLTLLCGNVVLAASGGAVAAFRAAVLYNNTAASKNLIGWYDYGSDYSIPDTKHFTIAFDGTLGAIQLAPR